MKRILAIIICICLHAVAFTQNYKFGKVSKEELEEKFYPLDSTAEAAYLNKYERRYYDFSSGSGLTLVTEVVERIKIYNKEGFRFATKRIPYYNPDSGSGDKLSSIKGYTYFLKDGKVEKVKLEKESIFKEKINSLFSAKKITLPNIKEGVVIEIKYSNRSPYYTSIDDFNFQYAIPVKNYDSQLEIPDIFGFNKRSRGYYSIPMQKTSKNWLVDGLYVDVFKFQGKDIPALSDREPYVYSYNDYRGGVEFELSSIDEIRFGGRYRTFSTSWYKVSQQIYNSSKFKDELKKSSFFKDDLSTITAQATTEADKAFAVFNFVKQKIKWNGNFGPICQKGLKKAYEERVGNIADINLTLVAMLREAGVNANPVLISTKSNGRSIFPSRDSFNAVICMVDFPDESYILLDASEPYSTANVLPARDLNWQGRKIMPDGKSKFVNITSKKYDTEENHVNVKITDDMMVEGLIRTKLSYLNALKFRKRHNNEEEESLIENFEDKNQVEVEDFKVVNSKKLGKPIVRTVRFSSEDLIEEINGKIYIEPLVFLSMHENPFKKEERTFPIDFVTSKKHSNVVTIQIPEGYKVTQLPKTVAIGLPDNLGVFKFQTLQNGNSINTRCVLQINKPLILPSYYSYLKGFFSEVVKKESEKIVLERI